MGNKDKLVFRRSRKDSYKKEEKEEKVPWQSVQEKR